jgi:cyclic lactone autoinducer peptide
MKNSNVKKFVLSLVSRIALKEASRSANTTCTLFSFQPIIPDDVKKLRKF